MASAPVIDETATELDSINELLDEQQKKRERDEARAPKGFDPAALFLLALGYENLFDPTREQHVWRCRGCGDDVKRWERKRHFDRHKRAADRGDIKATREARVTKRQQAENAQQAQESSTALEGAEKPAREASGGVAWRPSNTEESQAILDTLVRRFAKKLPKNAKLETKANEKVGYTSIKVNDKLVGYGWLTGKPQLRLEVAIEVDEAPKGARQEVLECKRSQTMRARTVITKDEYDVDIAILMLLAACGKWAGIK